MSVTVEAKMGALDLDKLEQCAKARGWRTARNAVVRLYRDVSRTMQLVVSPPNVGYDIGFNVTGEETETVFDSVMESSLMQLNEDYVTERAVTQTLAIVNFLGLSYHLLPNLIDIDTADDLRLWQKRNAGTHGVEEN